MRLRAAVRCGFSDMEEAFRGCGWTGNCARRAYRVRAPFARRAADNLPMHADKHRNPEPVEEGLSTRSALRQAQGYGDEEPMAASASRAGTSPRSELPMKKPPARGPEERRGGKKWGSTGRSRWAPSSKKK